MIWGSERAGQFRVGIRPRTGRKEVDKRRRTCTHFSSRKRGRGGPHQATPPVQPGGKTVPEKVEERLTIFLASEGKRERKTEEVTCRNKGELRPHRTFFHLRTNRH